MSEWNRREFLGATTYGLTRFSAGRAASEEDPLGVRADFPITGSGTTYLNMASFSPSPLPVVQAGRSYLEDKMMGRDAKRARKEATRRRVARLFGAKEQEIAFLYSTSDGENIVARSIDFQPGDNVVVDELHFTSSFVLYRELEQSRGIELRIVPQVEGAARLSDFEARTDARTKLVSVAWVSNRNGFRHDLPVLASLAHAKGALLYADAIQALGYSETNLTEIGVDFAASGCYKWLLGTPGISIFYVREEHLDQIRPDRFGHRQVSRELPDFGFEVHETARQYEYANVAGSPLYSLDAGLEYLSRVGLARIEAHTLSLARELRSGIVRLGFTPFTPPGSPTPIVSFEHGRDPEEMAERLRREKVAVTLREGGHLLRAGIGLFNNRDDVAKLLGIIEKLA